MVMEYLEGADLHRWLGAHGALPIEQAVEFVLQACEALAEAHALGIVHRDLKPSNLFCVRRADGLLAIKVLDFGISKIVAGPDMRMTRTQAVMGSPYYMSPEQMQSAKDVDARTDIWSLGVILYELVTARVPFGGEALPEVVLNVANAPAPPMRGLRPDVPPALEQVVQRCLAKDRERRYPHVAELAGALAEFAPPRAAASVNRTARVIEVAGLSTSSPSAATASPIVSAPPSVVDAPPPTRTATAWGRSATGARRHTTMALIGLSFGAVAALAAGLALVGRHLPSRALVHAPATARTAEPSAQPTPAFATAPAPGAAAALVDAAPTAMPERESSAAPAAVASTPPAEAAPASTPTAEAASASTPTAEATPASTPTAEATPAAPRAASSRGAPPRAASAAKSSVVAAKPACSAAPYLDSEGNVHFKQVCQ
jgi:serine/threonine-protein kinase